MADMLDAEDYDWHAGYVRHVMAMGHTPQLFVDALLAVEMWGGSGAVWEVSFPSLEQRERFWTSIVRLAEEMAAVGINSPRAEQIAGVLRYWIEADVLSRVTTVRPPPSPKRGPGENYIKRFLARRQDQGGSSS